MFSNKSLFIIILFIFAVCSTAGPFQVQAEAENWYSNAQWLLENNKFDKAMDAIVRALDVFPDNPIYLEFKQKILEDQKKHHKVDFNYSIDSLVVKVPPIEQKFENFGQKVLTVSTEERKLLRLAQHYLQDNRIQDGLYYINQSLKRDPNFSLAHALLGKIYFLKDSELSFSYFRKAYYNNPTPETILYLLMISSWEKKFDYLHTLIARHSKEYEKTDLGAFMQVFSFKRELDILLKKEFERQKVDKIEFLDMPSNLAIKFYNVKFIVSSIFEELDPFYNDYWLYNFLKGQFKVYVLEAEEAYPFFEKAYSQAPAIQKPGIQYYLDKYKDYKKVVLDPNSIEALLMKARNFYKVGNYNKSIQQAEKALAKGEAREEIYLILGLNYFKMGNYMVARENLEKAREKMGDDPRIMYTFGEIYFIERNYFEALKFYQSVIEKEPENVEALYRIGRIYSEQSENEKAIEYMKRVIDLDEYYVDAHMVLGNVYTKMNRFEEAIEAFNRVITMDTENVDAYVSLSIVYFKKWEIDSSESMIDSAIDILERASDIDPDNDTVKQYLEYYYQQKAGG